MYSERYLSISGYRGQQVPNEFLQQDQSSRHLAILLPGLGYSTDMPLMYYPAELLLNNQTDVLYVQYDYKHQEGYQAASMEARMNWLFEDASAACKAGLAQRPYTHITMIGKSLGTLAIGHLLTTQQGLQNARCVWLTPVLGIGSLLSQVTQEKRAALFVIGTADRHYDGALLKEAEQATGGQSLVIEGADHSLEFPKDLPRTLNALQQVMQAVEQFLSYN